MPSRERVKLAAGGTVRAEVVLPLGLDEAWDRLLDWESQPRWMRDADRVEVLTPHRRGVGVLIAVRTRVLNTPLFTDRLEVVVWDPPRRLRLAHRGLVGGFGEWRLAPVARGRERGTRFTWEERPSLAVPVLGAAALAAYRPFLRSLMRRSLDDLRRMVASGEPRHRT
ncbi:MAG: SRPBCC family protein [Actinomycetota bacterium]